MRFVLAQDSDGEAGAWERVPLDKVGRQAEGGPQTANLSAINNKQLSMLMGRYDIEMRPYLKILKGRELSMLHPNMILFNSRVEYK